MSDFMPGVNELPEIVERDLTDLTLWEDNPRTVKEVDFERLIEQIKLLGVYKPLLINQDNIVLGGNMRTQALKKMGVKKTICSLVKTDNKAQMMEYALSDNDQIGVTDEQAVAEYITLNPSIRSELFAINSSPMKLVSTVLQELSPEAEEDEPPEVSSEPPESQSGSIYLLGKHRVMCGNANALDDLVTQDVDMIFTDPPYNVDYTGKTKEALKIENDSFKNNDEYYDFLVEIFGHMATKIKGGAAVYVAHPDYRGEWVRRAFREAGFYLSQCIIWNKNSMVMGRQDYHWKHEPIIYGWREGASHKFYGPRNLTTVWDIDRPSRNEEHPTMKPVALIAKALNNSTKEGDIVLDPFGGSGSTLIACQQLDRVCYMMELDPRYCDVIRKRYWKLTHDNNEEGWQDGTKAIPISTSAA